MWVGQWYELAVHAQHGGVPGNKVHVGGLPLGGKAEEGVNIGGSAG